MVWGVCAPLPNKGGIKMVDVDRLKAKLEGHREKILKLWNNLYLIQDEWIDEDEDVSELEELFNDVVEDIKNRIL